MILQALAGYYERKSAADPESLAPPGLELKEVPFVIVLDESGRVVSLEDTREMVGKKLRAKRFLVPQGVKKTSGVRANLLWDTAEYVLGIDLRGNPKRVGEQHAAFVATFRKAFPDPGFDSGLRAVEAFLGAGAPLAPERFPEVWEEVREGNPVLSFRLAGDPVLVSERPQVREAIEGMGKEGTEIICSISGERDIGARLHPAIKGVRGAQSSGANIVSFNLPAFSSYGKEQGENAPAGERAVFRYTTALNHLLGKDSRQRVALGDTTIVFWAEKASGAPAEEAVLSWFETTDDPDQRTERLRPLLALKQGKPLTGDDDQKFYVLGLAPNAARIAVRFWLVGTIREIGRRIFDHFSDLEIVRGPRDPEFPGPSALLRDSAVLRKAENVSGSLSGDVIRAVLTGESYPMSLLQAAIRRARADQQIGYLRAAVIKACLNRLTNLSEEKITVALDPENSNVAYRLGRLFAVFERIQEEASPGINSTIKDRYFGAASSTPRSVFPILNRLKNHHLAKLENRGRAVNLEKLVGQIIEGLDASDPFPATLSLVDQGRFAVGYYHQRQHSSTYKSGGDN